MATSPQLRALGPDVRILAALLDAFIAGCEYIEDAWNHRLVRTAILAESGRREGFNEDQTTRTMRLWGAKDQHGIYNAAGLTKAEAEVAFLHFDRQLESQEIGKLLNRSAVTVRVQLHKAGERLRRLAA